MYRIVIIYSVENWAKMKKKSKKIIKKQLKVQSYEKIIIKRHKNAF